MHDAIPIPPNQGCIVFQTPRAPCRIRCPRPSSIRKRGTPSKMSITKKGMRKAPKMYTRKYRFNKIIHVCNFSYIDILDTYFNTIYNFRYIDT